MTDPKQLRYEIAKTQSDKELNELRDANLDYLNQHPYLFLIMKDHRKVLSHIRRIKFECTPITELN